MNFFHLCPLYATSEGISGQVTKQKCRSCRNLATFAAVEQQKKNQNGYSCIRKESI